MTSSDAPVAVETEIPITSPVRSLVWSGDTLVDWSCGRSYSPNGETISFGYFFGRQFDAATTSQDKQYTVIFAKTGTKGLVLDTGKVIREINRSYYQSDIYEYPVAIIEPGGGRKILAHCATSYNRLEFEELQTGEPLGIGQPRNPDDFFSFATLCITEWRIPGQRWLGLASHRCHQDLSRSNRIERPITP